MKTKQEIWKSKNIGFGPTVADKIYEAMEEYAQNIRETFNNQQTIIEKNEKQANEKMIAAEREKKPIQLLKECHELILSLEKQIRDLKSQPPHMEEGRARTAMEVLEDYIGETILPYDEQIIAYYPAIINAMEEYAKYFNPQPSQPGKEEVMKLAIVMRDDYNRYITTLSEELQALRSFVIEHKWIATDLMKNLPIYEEKQEAARGHLSDSLKHFIGNANPQPSQPGEGKEGYISNWDDICETAAATPPLPEQADNAIKSLEFHFHRLAEYPSWIEIKTELTALRAESQSKDTRIKELVEYVRDYRNLLDEYQSNYELVIKLDEFLKPYTP